MSNQDIQTGNHKLMTLSEVIESKKAASRDGWGFPENRITLVTGCFDIIHAGHVQLLEHASRVDPLTFLFVGMNSDAAITKLKGPGRPINTFVHRAKVMAAIEYVHGLFEIDDVRVANTILAVRPSFWVKGGDYTLDTLDKEEVQAAKTVGAEIVLFRSEYDISTTKLLNKSKS